MTAAAPPRARPRLGFAGIGWIGLNRLRAIAEDGAADIVAAADPSTDATSAAREISAGCTTHGDFEELLQAGLDGVVIATPSALHAEQAISALEQGIAVFCQKPLGRTAEETRRVVDAARAADRLLAVDLSYRYTAAAQSIRELVRSGALGRVYAMDLVFHNAYGPDKPWFRNRALSGGGCVIDLGVHLVDLALWTLDFPRVTHVTSRLFSRGVPLHGRAVGEVEDHAEARIDFEDGATARVTCSWNLPVGRDAEIGAAFHGTAGGAALRNVNGSFLDFVAERFQGTRSETLSAPPDAWGGRAAADWARRLASGERYDPSMERMVEVAAVLDRIYQ